jgi:hypothetical protein
LRRGNILTKCKCCQIFRIPNIRLVCANYAHELFRMHILTKTRSL